jgi:two-component system, NarL family, sensor kinase
VFQNSSSNIVAYYLVGSLLLLSLITAIVIYAYLHQKKVLQLRNRLHEEEIRKQQAVFNALQEGEESERTRLSEELHDGIGAKLSGLKMILEYLLSNSKENKELIAKIFTGVSETVEEVRAISHNLQAYSLNNKDIEQLLLSYMEQLSTRNGCRYDLILSSPVHSISNHVKLQCYRIVAELLHNIHKHAKATQASVQINVENEHLEIVVEDNGVGIYSRAGNQEGIGIKNIRNRVNLCKGIVSIDSSEKGTTVIIEIPINSIA